MNNLFKKKGTQNTPTNNQKYLSRDAVHLPYINRKLYLTSARGSSQIHGSSTANITVAGKQTVEFLRHHASKYRAYVIVQDTHNISYENFKNIFNKASALLEKQYKDQSINEVIVSCHAGINRSVTLILFHDIKYKKIRTVNALKKEIDYIRNQNKRHRELPALINDTFERYLYRYLNEKK